MKTILLGPYIGDFKHEIEEFYPFVCWFTENVSKDVFLSTHMNRLFMYDIENTISFYEILSREEHKQDGYLHSDIDARDYVSIILKNIKEEISNQSICLKKDLLNYNVSYVKSTTKIPWCQKHFKQIPYEETVKKIVFIPDESGDINIMKDIHKHLKDKYNEEFLLIGDNKTYFKEDNIVLNQYNYFEYGYKNIVNLISNAKLVITPCSHWTLLSNIQKVPVLSWGENALMYKDYGCFNLDNKDCYSISTEESSIVIRFIDKLLEKENM